MADSPLAPLIAKLDRADESLSALDHEIRTLADGKPLRFEIDVDFQTGWNTAKIEHAEPLPPSASILLGESLYHARSALEHLIWGLVKANHKKPGKHNRFPVVNQGTPEKFMADMNRPRCGRHSAGPLRGVPKGARTLIERLQPYNTSHGDSHYLSILNRMARDDRHHAVHTSFVGGHALDIEHLFRPLPGYRITEFQNLMRNGKGMVCGTKIARFRVEPLTRNPKVGMEGDIPVLIAFGDRAHGVVLIGDFKSINESVRNLIGFFQKFL